ncbi:MAG: hypothetical protein JW864_13350 [Spirochaetes bacterium]|nr:hypothetical protein [Spirochaetota bacterium]
MPEYRRYFRIRSHCKDVVAEGIVIRKNENGCCFIEVNSREVPARSAFEIPELYDVELLCTVPERR